MVQRKIYHNQLSRPVTQLQLCDIIISLDLYGLITAQVVLVGRYDKIGEIVNHPAHRAGHLKTILVA